jgi:hypothetical protein
MEKKIQVPEGMLKAGIEAWRMDLPLSTFPSVTAANTTQMILEAALRWLSRNPILPTVEQACVLRRFSLSVDQSYNARETTAAACMGVAVEWQLIMFLAPEPEVPEAIKDLLENHDAVHYGFTSDTAKKAILEAYRRGQNSVRDVAAPWNRGVK